MARMLLSRKSPFLSSSFLPLSHCYSPKLLPPSHSSPLLFPSSSPTKSLFSTMPFLSSPSSSWYFPPFSSQTLSSTAFQMASTPSSPPLLQNPLTHQQLRNKAKILSKILLHSSPSHTSPTVAFMLSPSPSLPLLLLSVWEAGGAAMGVGVGYPAEEVEWLVKDSGAGVLVVDSQQWERLESSLSGSSLPARVVLIDDLLKELEEEEKKGGVRKEDREEEEEGVKTGIKRDEDTALICYTSGTTGRPKGVKVTHKMLESQIRAISSAWEFTEKDSVLNTLPLHHMHGLVNVMLCPLFSGGTVSFIDRFEPTKVWNALLCPKLQINVFSAVPTMYHRLLKESPSPSSLPRSLSAKTRLMMSGSAACPKTVKEDWKELTGINLLERYGMSETGMLLSQPYKDPQRPVGSVGFPLPGVKVEVLKRIEEGDEEGKEELILEKELKERGWEENLVWRGEDEGEGVKEGEEGGIVGTLVVKGDNVFKSYWNRPEEVTAKEFTRSGWFITGDSVSFSPRTGFQILGRNSIDIIKSSGAKISALEIERVLLDHPLIDEVAVVGVEEEERGECVVAVVTLLSPSSPSLPLVEADEEVFESVKREGRKGLAAYKLPRRVFVWKDGALPKNPVGKVNKKEIKKMVTKIMQENSK